MAPWTVAHRAPLSMGFSRQAYWHGLSLAAPEDLPGPGIQPTSLVTPALAGGFLTATPPGRPRRRGTLFIQRKSRFCHQTRGVDVGQAEMTAAYLDGLYLDTRHRDENAPEAGVL